MAGSHAAPKALLLGISGVSSCGKTTLARLLRDIFPRSSVLHQDDFYKPDAEIPVNKDGVRDWDCLASINLPAFASALRHIREHGTAPPDVVSKEDQNPVGQVPVSQALIEDLIRNAAHWADQDAPPIWIVDGFLLFSNSMGAIRELFDIKLFLYADASTARARREARAGYVTLEGFWQDPPGYVDNVVWPNYVNEHKFLFRDENVEAGEFDDDVLKELGIRAMPGEAQGNMAACVKWAGRIVDEALQAFVSRDHARDEEGAAST